MGGEYSNESRQRDLLTFALVKLLVFAPLAHLTLPKKHALKQAVICAALGRLRWSLLKIWLRLVFFNVRIVSKSPAEFSPPIGAFMQLRSNTSLPCLVVWPFVWMTFNNSDFNST